MRSMVSLILLGVLYSCSAPVEKDSNTEAPTFIHNVYFYFNDTVDLQLAKDFTNGLNTLATVSSIHKVTYGPPASTETPREVVDNTYDYAYLVEFLTEEDHESYQVDPIHLEFIEKYKSLWKEVKVYDNIVQNNITK